MKKNLLIVLLVCLVLIFFGAILFMIFAPKIKAPTTSETADTKTTLEIPQFGVLIPEHPETQKIVLKAQEGNLFADAYILRKNERLYIYIYSDLPVRLDGSRYKAWLFDGEQSYEYLGDLENQDGQYVLKFESEILHEDKNILIVTLNNSDDDNLGEQILIGSI